MCSSGGGGSKYTPTPPPAPVEAPILTLDENGQARLNSSKSKQRLGTKSLQIPLTANTQSGLAIPTGTNG
jgi:hypothetical protein